MNDHPVSVYNQIPAMLPPDQLFGPLFHDVQMQHVFPDSITFADAYPRQSPERILSQYEVEQSHSEFRLYEFVQSHFIVPAPVLVDYVSDRTLSTADHLHQLWDKLTHKSQPNCSLLPIPKPYIVPGGRFRGMYYWDSYFTMLGLNVSGQQEHIRHMVDNCAYLIDTYGHVPNANRSYYITRSQPPFFAYMVRLLADIDGPETLTRYLPFLQKEYNFWVDGYFRLGEAESSFRRVICLPNGVILNRYWDDTPAPRPESYREDVELAQEAFSLGIQPSVLYRHVRAACETGWDFSCRWFADEQRLVTIRTTEIVPVDLNCLLYYLERTLALAYRQSNFLEAAERFDALAATRCRNILTYFWNEEAGFFMDYDSVSNQHTPVWSLAGLFPLYVGIASPEQAERIHEHVKTKFLQAGGVVSTLHTSGQQWDAPNGWAPLQWIAHQALIRYGFLDTAAKLRERWLGLNDTVFQNTGKMMEKYNVINTNLPAGGGEYPNQDGFGWTNGIYLSLQANDGRLVDWETALTEQPQPQ
ncbi:alpha,alpha-trehalase TreF [Fibrisoma montanum]|uniref:Alpha,alpha-trehalase TreF n=1 Tax=Fibrisoma montanum TaxID=2305895 RepID=A0A418MCF6_9BACT|nr:alpha,alpha-trehalase TreF [Fibrisoma montanum]RIV24045.1 alpha,alpha-trehalase TreF [Fibrisoma montanum]